MIPIYHWHHKKRYVRHEGGTICLTSIVLMLVQGLRRWPNIKTAEMKAAG